MFRGGVVAYHPDLKVSLLGVAADLISRCGVVNPDVASAMATGVAARLGCEVGVATTGVAGPGAADGVDQGRVYVAASVRRDGCSRVVVRELTVGGTRAIVRRSATYAALALVGSLLASAEVTR